MMSAASRARVFAPHAVPVRAYTSRRIKTLFKTASVPEDKLFITDPDSPLFGQVPFDSPLLGPKPLPKQRKRRSPYWRVTPGSAFAEKYYTHDADLQAREKQRLAEMRTQFQVQRIGATSGAARLAAVAALARSAPAAAAQLLGSEEKVAQVLKLQADLEAAAQQQSQPSAEQQQPQQQQESETAVAVPVLRKWEPQVAVERLPTEDATAVMTAEVAAEQAAAEAAAKAAGEKPKPPKAAKAVPAANNGQPRAPTAAQKKKKKEDFFVGDDE